MSAVLASDGYLAALIVVLALEVGVLGLRSLRRWYRYRPVSARAIRRMRNPRRV